MNIPLVTKDFEKFDFVHYDSIKAYSERNLDDGTHVVYEEQSNGYIKKISISDSYFMIIKRFYKNGNIAAKGLSINNGDFFNGVWYYFDEAGKFVGEVNYDTPFVFTFENLLNYLQSQKIPVTMSSDKYGLPTRIYREIIDQVPIWKIEWMKDTTNIPNTIEQINIDGKTGKILSKKDWKYSMD